MKKAGNYPAFFVLALNLNFLFLSKKEALKPAIIL